MKKITTLLFSLLIIMLVSCQEKIGTMKIENMTATNGIYQLTVSDNVKFIDLINYIDYGGEYKIIVNDKEYSSMDQTIFELSNGNNYFTIKSQNQEFKLLFYKEYFVKVIILNNDMIEISSFEISANSKILMNDIIDLNIIDEGYSWNGEVSYSYDAVTFEKNYIENISTKEDVYLILNLVANEYEVNLIVDDKVSTIKIRLNSLLNLENLNKEGFKFIGWFAKDVLITDDTIYSLELGNEFIAKFEKLNYQLTYKYLDKEKTIEIGYKDEIEEFIPKVDGYTFDGWYYNGEVFNNTLFEFNTDIILTAKFNPNSYKIKYTNIDEEKMEDVLYGQSFTLFVPSKENYKFLYWEYEGNVFNEGKWSYLSDITLKAVWQLSKVNLNLDPLGGEVNSIGSVDDNGNIKLPIPILEQYTFRYWCFDKALKEKVDSLNVDNYQGEMLYAYYEYDSEKLKSQTIVNIFNEHATNYDMVTMFDSSKSNFASKYWHKIGIDQVGDSYFVSNIVSSGTSITELGEYDYVIMAYSNYQGFSEFKSLDCLIGYQVKFLIEPNSMISGELINIVSFFESDITDDIDFINQYLNDIYGDYEKLNCDIELIDSFNNYQIEWISSNTEVISNDGKYKKPYTTVDVVLTAYVQNQEVYKFRVEVEGLNSESGALATGYIYTPYNTITQNAMNQLDIIYCAFLDIDANANWTNLSTITNNINNYIRPKANIAGTKIVISVNQKASGNFSSVAASETLREKLASNILDVIETLEIDGVDIDWETPTSSEASNFTFLMQAIYNKVKAANQNYLVTAAIGGGKWQPPKYDLPNSNKYLDYVNLMTYSMATSNGYYQNSLYPSTKGRTLVSCSIDESVKIFNDLGVLNSQILVGIPFYVTVQSNCDGVGSKTGSGKSIWYDKMFTTYAISDTMKEYFDEECGVPYRYDAVNKIFISFDNEESIKRKCEYINARGLAGIMYWQYGQDVNDMLSNAIGKYINA